MFNLLRLRGFPVCRHVCNLISFYFFHFYQTRCFGETYSLDQSVYVARWGCLGSDAILINSCVWWLSVASGCKHAGFFYLMSAAVLWIAAVVQCSARDVVYLPTFTQPIFFLQLLGFCAIKEN